MKVIKDGKVIDVTEKAYEIVYKGYGYSIYNGKEVTNYEDATKADLKARLDAKGISYSDRDNKEKLISLLVGE